MHIAAWIISLISAGCLVFGYWGAYTTSGQKRFDEMAGIIPHFCLLLGGILAVTAIVLWIVVMAKSSGN